MSDAEIPLKISLQKGGALDQAKGLATELKNVNAGLVASSKAAAQSETDAFLAAATKRKQGSKQAASAMVADLGEVATKGKQSAQEISAAFERSGASSSQGLASIGSGLSGLMGTMGSLIGLTKVYGDAVKEVGDKMDARARAVNAQFDALARLGALKGEPVGAKTVVEAARLGRRTLMAPAESIAARESFLDAGAQNIGGAGQLDKATADKAFERTARLAVAKKVTPEVVADLTGRSLGMKDYARFGAKAPEEIQKDINSSLSVLSSGSGKESQLVPEVSKLAASSVSEDALRGSLKSLGDATKLISVLTEAFPEGQAEAAKSALRGLRGFDPKKKQSGLLKEAGITPDMDVFASLEKLAPVLEAHAKAGPKGTTVEDVIRQNFKSELDQKAVGALINRGVFGGLFSKRDAIAAEASKPGAAEATIASFDASQAGVERRNAREAEYLEAQKGARTSKIAQLEDEAKNDMTRSGKTNTVESKTLESIIKYGSFGAFSPREWTRDKVIKRHLLGRMPEEARAKYAGVEIPGHPEMRADLLNRMIGDVEAGGRSAISDSPLSAEESATLKRDAVAGMGGMGPRGPAGAGGAPVVNVAPAAVDTSPIATMIGGLLSRMIGAAPPVMIRPPSVKTR